MYLKLIVLFFCFYFADIVGAQSYRFRFDYTYSKEAEGWLKLHRVPATWGDARLICHAEGAVLASPLTNKLRLAMIEHVARNNCAWPTIFTGIHTTYSKGSYASIEGVPLSRIPITWAPGEPDNAQNAESCLAMRTSSNGTLGDVCCDDVLPYVCYKKRTGALVFNACGTHDPEYTLDSRTGSCYKFHRRGLIWSRAYMTCMAEGAYLMIINSDQESQIINELFNKNPSGTITAQFTQYAAIGHYDANDGGSWLTIHGQTPSEAGFSRWQPGEPNNGTQPRGEFCGCTQRGYPYLHDSPCDWVTPFICEKTPESLETPDQELY